MPEDKLTADQRLRLECLAQANGGGGWGLGSPRSMHDVVARAKVFEAYVRGEGDEKDA